MDRRSAREAMTVRVVSVISLFAPAMACLAVVAAADRSLIEVRTSEIWRHRESGESATVITAGEYGCREHASRSHVLAPGGSRWILETWEAPREGILRQRLVDDASGWFLEIEDREPAWHDFTGPQAFARSRFWERANRGEYAVDRTVRITGGGTVESRYRMVDGTPVDTDDSRVRAALEAARATAGEPLLARLRTLHEILRSDRAGGSGFAHYSELMDLAEAVIGTAVPAPVGEPWRIEDTRAFRDDPADAAALADLLRAFTRVGEPADPLADLHVSRPETCGIGAEDLLGSD